MRQHKYDLHVEHNMELQDFVLQHGHLENLTAGKVVTLPSSFQGSTHNMTLQYEDVI